MAENANVGNEDPMHLIKTLNPLSFALPRHRLKEHDNIGKLPYSEFEMGKASEA